MRPSPPPSSRLIWLLVALYGIVIGMIVMGFGWTWDDRDLIVGGRLEPMGQALSQAWTGDFWGLSTSRQQHDSGMYRPLVLTSYILERSLFGLSPGLSHVVNLSLHVMVAGTVGALAVRMGGNRLVAMAIVLVHPHSAELVGSVAARTDLMATLAVVASLVIRSPDSRTKDNWAALVLMGGCLCKEVAFSGALLWVAVDLLQGRREPRRWLPAFLAVGTAILLRIRFVGALDPDAVGFAVHPLLGATSTGWALADLLVPIPAGPWPAPHVGPYGPICLFLVLAGSVRWQASRILLLWVALTWAPMAGWIPVEVRPSRALLYLPLVGLALGAAYAWNGLQGGERQPSRVALAGSFALAGLLIGLHITALLPWRDPQTLWAWGVETHPDHPLPHLNLGRALLEAQGGQAAEEAYRQAAGLALDQRNAALFIGAASALGSIALERGDETAARAYFEDAIGAAGPSHAPEAVEMLQSIGPVSPRP